MIRFPVSGMVQYVMKMSQYVLAFLTEIHYNRIIATSKTSFQGFSEDMIYRVSISLSGGLL